MEVINYYCMDKMFGTSTSDLAVDLFGSLLTNGGSGDKAPKDRNKKAIGSIFLAGPNSDCYHNSWRKEFYDAISKADISVFGEQAEEKFKDNYVELFIPEFEDSDRFKDIDTMSKEDAKNLLDSYHLWELQALNKADVIVFWIPRCHDKGVYGSITNIEFGYWINNSPKKVLLGFPEDADDMSYIEYLYDVQRGGVCVHDIETLATMAFLKIATKNV